MTEINPETVASAKRYLQDAGYAVLKEKSYRQAQERQRVAEAMRAYAEELRASNERWAQEQLCPEIRRLTARLMFVYGAARAHGATVEELSG